MSDDIWNSKVLNKDALGEGEKKLYCEIEPILCGLLDELETKGKIETSFNEDRRVHLKNILDNLQQMSINHNVIIALFDETNLFQVSINQQRI
jgi:hypothetical protein